MAEDFYGYGRWEAPFCFIGPEAGMGNDGKDNLAARYQHGSSGDGQSYRFGSVRFREGRG